MITSIRQLQEQNGMCSCSYTRCLVHYYLCLVIWTNMLVL